MEAIILHKQGERVGDLQKGLSYENISIHSKIWRPGEEIDDNFLNANVIIIHCTSPDFSILEVIQKIKFKKSSATVVILDENQNEKTRGVSENLGADKYISQPVSFRNLAFELKSLVYKKEYEKECHWLRAFNIWLDLEHRFVKREKHVIPLRNKEFSLLEFFIINRGKVLTRNEILEYVWDRNANFASNTVDVHINRLRKKIDGPFKNKLIHTIHCIGYSFGKNDEN